MTRAARDGRRDARDEAGPTRGYSNVYGFNVYTVVRLLGVLLVLQDLVTYI